MYNVKLGEVKTSLQNTLDTFYMLEADDTLNGHQYLQLQRAREKVQSALDDLNKIK